MSRTYSFVGVLQRTPPSKKVCIEAPGLLVSIGQVEEAVSVAELALYLFLQRSSRSYAAKTSVACIMLSSPHILTCSISTGAG